MPKQDAWDSPEAGSFNVAPAHFQPITEAEFAQKFFTWTVEKVMYRQIHRTFNGEPIQTLQGVPPSVGYLETRLFWIHNGMGFAVSKTWEAQPKMLFFEIGVCDHAWEELGQAAARAKGIEHYGMFCHVYYCSKCGRHYSTDSSD